jgi:two-component system, response regulator
MNLGVDIVLVEDDADEAELILRVLGKHRLSERLRHVRDGQAALDLLLGPDAPRPKLILLDLKLPKVGGVEVLRKLKSDARTRTIPVVVLTSSKETRDVDECYSLGANSYILKPVDFESFSDSVANLALYWLILNQRPSHA